MPPQYSATSELILIAAVGLGMNYKVNILSPNMFVRKELSNASVVYQMLKKWKRPEAVNFFEVLKMQSNKLPVGFNCDKLVKLA
ncbi:MAG TPA: hypothetical protein VGD26_13745, partial [Chitinophagaceae bacterium]